NVADGALTSIGAPGNYQATEGVASSNVFIASFTDADPNGTSSDYSASIAWGDGTTSSGQVSGPFTGGSFSVMVSHAFKEEGTFTPAVTISDVGGQHADGVERNVCGCRRFVERHRPNRQPS